MLVYIFVKLTITCKVFSVVTSRVCSLISTQRYRRLVEEAVRKHTRPNDHEVIAHII